jgi:hypothetical protein
MAGGSVMAGYPQAEADEHRPCGEGVTRTTDPKARLWPVTVTFTSGARPMRTTIRAISSGQAEQFARARHPYVRSVAVERVPL